MVGTQTQIEIEIEISIWYRVIPGQYHEYQYWLLSETRQFFSGKKRKHWALGESSWYDSNIISSVAYHRLDT